MASVAQPQAAISKSRFTGSVAKDLALALLLVVATAALYAPVHDHPFANVDDASYVFENPHIRGGLSLQTTVWAFTHGYSANWHPLTWLSHAVDIDLFGLDPSGHHDENVALHIVDALLVFWVLKRATGYRGRSFMVAALFAVHPINVENVAWVAERKTLLSTLFFLLALGAYRWYASRPGLGRYTVVAVTYGFGLACKPQIIPLPFVLLLWDYWPLRRMFPTPPDFSIDAVAAMPPQSLRWLILEKLPLLFMGLVASAITMLVQQTRGPGYPLYLRLGNAVLSYVRYLGKAIWPLHLGMYYPHPGYGLRWWQGWGAFLVLLAITAVVFAARRHRYLLVGWLWFLGTMVPMIGLVQVDVQGMADRYAYVSFLGLFVMLCWGLADWAAQQHVPAMALPVASAVILLLLMVQTHRQIGYWSDDITLWTHAVEVSPDSWKAEYFVGYSLDAQHRYTEAQPHYLKAAAVNPYDPFLNFYIAANAQRAGDLPTALTYYQRALRDSWGNQAKEVILKQIALVYSAMGDPAHAQEYFERANQTPDARPVDWQGAWWKQVIPMTKEYLHRKFSSN